MLKVLLVKTRFRSSDSTDFSQALDVSLGCLSTAWKVVGSGRCVATGCFVEGWFVTAVRADRVVSGRFFD